MPCAEVTTDFSFGCPGVQQVSIIYHIAVSILALGLFAVFIIARKISEQTKEFGGQEKAIDLKK